MKIFIVVIGFILVFSVGEVLFRFKVLTREHARKLIHVSSGIWTMCTPFFISFQEIFWIALGFSAFLAVLHGSNTFTSITKSQRKTFGVPLMPLGIALSAFIAPSDAIFNPAIAILTFADTAAGIIGKGTKKSAKGSSAFFIVTCIVLYVLPFVFQIPNFSNGRVFFMAICLTLIEKYSPAGSDNFTIPVGASFLLLLIA